MIKKIIRYIPYIKTLINDRDNLLKERDFLKSKIDSLEIENFKNIEEKVDSLNFKTNLIMDYFIDPKKALPATGNTRNAQIEMTNMLKEFKSIMEKHHISYWLDFGTLLGAVRHKGFIPWDTDVDVSVMEEDIIKIEKLCKSNLSDKYEFINYWKGFVYRIKEKKKKNGIFLDIYPYIVYGKDINGIKKIILKKGTPIPAKNYKPDKPLPINIIFPLSEIIFEKIKFKTPHNTDIYLKLRYGNYNVLPKKEHCEPGHIIIDDSIEFYPEDKFIKLS